MKFFNKLGRKNRAKNWFYKPESEQTKIHGVLFKIIVLHLRSELINRVSRTLTN